MTKIAVIGSIVADLAVRTPRVPQVGENLLAESFHTGPGGKGTNAAVAVARAGAEAVLVGCAGDDNFARIEFAQLKKEGVNVDAVATTTEASTGVGQVIIADG